MLITTIRGYFCYLIKWIQVLSHAKRFKTKDKNLVKMLNLGKNKSNHFSLLKKFPKHWLETL